MQREILKMRSAILCDDCLDFLPSSWYATSKTHFNMFNKIQQIL